MKSLRESFIAPKGYVIRQQKEQQYGKICTKKHARKRCPSQLNIKLITKNIKNLQLHFSWNKMFKSNNAHYFDTVKRKQKPAKKRISKNHELL